MLGRRILSRRRLALPLRSGVFFGLRLRPAERGCECGDIPSGKTYFDNLTNLATFIAR